MFPRPDFFTGSLLNFAENLLYPPNIIIQPNDIAIIASTESSNREITWNELRSRVKSISTALRKLGVRTNDRVAGFLGNSEKAVIAMLATTSIGAIWTGISPDTGVSAVLERLVQIEPVSIIPEDMTLGKITTAISIIKCYWIQEEILSSENHSDFW